MNKVYLLLGSNLDDRLEYLSKARLLISEHIGPVKSSSSIYESEPWGFDSENSFLNQVLMVESDLDPFRLIAKALRIEERLGRTRDKKEGYQSRIIDIDVLFFNDEVINTDELVIPHPRLHQRLFTLMPLGELSGEKMHPLMKKNIRQLIKECPDNGRVTIYPHHIVNAHG
jgi:2-amino-4-hydroxy-6-hydroxymethyldihydropteridine diphosphokinase